MATAYDSYSINENEMVKGLTFVRCAPETGNQLIIYFFNAPLVNESAES